MVRGGGGDILLLMRFARAVALFVLASIARSPCFARTSPTTDGMVLVWKRSDTAGASGAGGNAFSMQADVDEGQQEWWVVTHMLRYVGLWCVYMRVRVLCG